MTTSFAQDIRKDFPFLSCQKEEKSLIYLDSAATTQKPQCVIDQIIRYYTYECGTVHRSLYSLSTQATEQYNQVRVQIAHFIRAKSPNEIIFTRGTTEGINLVAHGYASILKEGDEILISEMEHHSNFVPWQLLCQKTKATLKYVPVTDKAELDLAAFEKLLTPQTKLVAIAHIANSTGTLNPIKILIEKAHSYNAKVLIDAAQSIAHLPLNVTELDIDYLAFSGHKAFGPTGVGVLYGKETLLELLPPFQGGGDMIETVSLEGTTFAKPPLKFEAGTPPIAQVLGLGAAVTYLNTLGLENIHAWEQKLLYYATEQLTSIPGLKIIGEAKEKGGIISFIINKIHPSDLATLLDLENIAIRSGHHCAQPLLHRFGLKGTCRISFAPYNTFEEIDLFLKALKNAVRQLKV